MKTEAWNKNIEKWVYLEIDHEMFHVYGRNKEGHVDHFYFDTLSKAKVKFNELKRRK